LETVDQVVDEPQALPAKGFKSICHLELIDPHEEVVNPDETGAPVFRAQ
jgi:hypothetical protein